VSRVAAASRLASQLASQLASPRGAPTRRAATLKPVSARSTQARLLWIAATDRTFTVQRTEDGLRVLVGKCIHCGSKHALTTDGAPLTEATIEHIEPRTHGGTDALENLAIACARCNRSKGSRLDARRRDDPVLTRVIDALLLRRRARWREPPRELVLPRWEDVVPAEVTRDGAVHDARGRDASRASGATLAAGAPVGLHRVKRR
jgi:5-methylcytosine-specific restriction endonuclease McrA